jgi:hypothetical protein
MPKWGSRAKTGFAGRIPHIRLAASEPQSWLWPRRLDGTKHRLEPGTTTQAGSPA